MESSENIDIFLLVAIGGAAMTLLAGFIVFFVVLYQKKVIIQRNEIEAIKVKHQRELLQRTLEVEEREREQIAKNIHDDLGALISILRLNNSRTAKNIADEEVLMKIYESNSLILNKTSESIRSISKKLASPTLVKLGYVIALREICNAIHQTGEIIVEFDNRLNQEIDLTPQQASHLFRASQEIINNILKHANPNWLKVKLANLDEKIGIEFIHNGLGINEKEVIDLTYQKKGIGLSSIQSRLSIIDAEIDFLAPVDGNASVLITYKNDKKKD
ncbi:MAG: hypothetical protein IT222_08725 [Crocinitomix sp.]|nr:hypothetical protein [Crocinitomix sp.]